MNHGLRIPQPSHKDFDFHKSFGSIDHTVPAFPPEYNTDAGLWMPDQHTPDPIFNNPALPYGCTDYTQADIAADIAGRLYNPADLEAITHANANFGADIRVSLMAAIKLGWIKYFFNIQAYAPLDYFDAFRYAQLVGLNDSTHPELRSISIGTPWFASWEKAALSGQRVMPMPTQNELQLARYNPNALTWHNHAICGWKQINGTPMLVDKSLQGTRVGDNGYLYFPREVINVVMALPFTIAFTASNNMPGQIERISLPFLQWIQSFLKNMLSLHY